MISSQVRRAAFSHWSRSHSEPNVVRTIQRAVRCDFDSPAGVAATMNVARKLCRSYCDLYNANSEDESIVR